MNHDALIAAYRAAGQEQVFAFWADLSAAEQTALAKFATTLNGYRF